ncbi:metallophosphoesterase [Heyndrickxia sp. NPDC080065]|uniref:metallophosphoesterase n=1 Tax=Heyndrickxia sp. NPDC080065 TaxID=3390568 RepID=UPI003D0669F7
MTNTVSRRSFLKKAMGTMLSMIGIGSGGYIYSRYIEPKRLEIKTLTVENKKVPPSFDQFTIVQFSDTHLGFQYTLDQLEQHVQKINSFNPDIIFFTGDLMDEPNQYPDINKIPPILNNLKAPYGKYAVYGNHDHGGYGTNIYSKTMKESGFTVLRNQMTPIYHPDGSAIYLAGIDDAMLGKPNLTQALRNIPKNSYNILLSHAPDLADIASFEGVDFQLSGHSHGGQIQIPFYGALITPPYGKKYIEGEYFIKKNNPLVLYVNRGLGTTRLPFRFLAVPEITVIKLKAIGK